MKLSGGQRIAALVAAATLAAAGVAVVAVAEPSFQASSFAASPSSAPSGGLTVAPFASRYGQTPAAVTALESYLNGYGISASVYPDDLDVTANGTVAQFNSALSVQQRQYKVPAVPAHDGQAAIPAQQVHGTEGDPYLPASIGPAVLAVLGLTNYAPFSDDLTHTPKGAAASSSQGTSNDNLYYTGTPGQLFNPGSGLRYPDLAKLAGDFG